MSTTAKILMCMSGLHSASMRLLSPSTLMNNFLTSVSQPTMRPVGMARNNMEQSIEREIAPKSKNGLSDKYLRRANSLYTTQHCLFYAVSGQDVTLAIRDKRKFMAYTPGISIHVCIFCGFVKHIPLLCPERFTKIAVTWAPIPHCYIAGVLLRPSRSLSRGAGCLSFDRGPLSVALALTLGPWQAVMWSWLFRLGPPS